MKTLHIIRGLPGSGKSTYAQSLGVPYFEADMYFMRDGEYMFNTSRLHQAHEWCFNCVCAHIESNVDVAVSNTFTTVKEMKRYVEVARAHNYLVNIIEVKTSYGSVHNVPEETLAKMKARWQEVPDDMYDILQEIR